VEGRIGAIEGFDLVGPALGLVEQQRVLDRQPRAGGERVEQALLVKNVRRLRPSTKLTKYSPPA
jgi:hypothetical protein